MLYPFHRAHGRSLLINPKDPRHHPQRNMERKSPIDSTEPFHRFCCVNSGQSFGTSRATVRLSQTLGTRSAILCLSSVGTRLGNCLRGFNNPKENLDVEDYQHTYGNQEFGVRNAPHRALKISELEVVLSQRDEEIPRIGEGQDADISRENENQPPESEVDVLVDSQRVRGRNLERKGKGRRTSKSVVCHDARSYSHGNQEFDFVPFSHTLGF